MSMDAQSETTGCRGNAAAYFDIGRKSYAFIEEYRQKQIEKTNVFTICCMIL